jgi:ATP-dependent DNA helicase RecG
MPAPRAASSAAPPLEAQTRVQFLPGVGPQRARLFEKLGLHTVEHLLRHYPRTHLDASHFVKIADLKPGELLTVQGEIHHAAAVRTRGGRTDFTCTVRDPSGTIGCYFFGQSFLARLLRPGTRVVVSGEWDAVERRMLNPLFEVVEGDVEELLHAGRLVPVHPLTKGLNARTVRRAMRAALDSAVRLADPLPQAVRTAEQLGSLAEALEGLHFPKDAAELARSRARLVFEELFLLQMVIAVRREARRVESRGLASEVPGVLAGRARAALPYTLTEDQDRSLGEIVADLAAPRPMQRLLLGDVGSGKTVVAALAALHVVEAGHQAAFMAPTEILARQHAATLGRICAPAGVAVAALTGSTPAGERRALAARLAAGEPMIVAGTHALIVEKVQLPRLALAIVDEQHRFGVQQRAKLAMKAVMPDVLVLTATPIPRTLTLAFYGDLDVSRLNARPAGRGRLVTRVAGEEKLPQVMEFLARELAAGRQAYWVTPLIEEGGKMEAKAAEAEYERLKSHPLLKRRTLGLLHGRLKPDEKQDVMGRFAAGQVDVLVATTVIEVGVDVPNATVLVVRDADRFGLTQLHQLRGRIGRGAHRSVCVLTVGPGARPKARERLVLMTTTQDGYVLAEADLRLRGPGEMWGTLQSGMPRLKLADLAHDQPILERAHLAALALAERDPRLTGADQQPLREALLARYPEPLEIALAG